MTIAIISHPDCALHDMGDTHPESPLRIRAIQDSVINSGLEEVTQTYQANTIDKKRLALVHDQDYIDFIFNNSPTSGNFELDPDTIMNPASLNAALLAAGAATMGVDLVMKNKHSAAFCLTRPPGHHAERDKAMGFCIFNHVAVAAIYAQEHYALKRVAIVDFDVHHGNGTQNIVADKSGLLFCSTFEHPLYPNSGLENHPQHIINSPLPANTTGIDFRHIIKTDWLPALARFEPELILISAGFDGHIEDAISQMQLTEQDYLWVTQQIKAIADQYSQGRIVSVLEGGYSLNALGRSVVAHIKGLIG